MQSDSADRSPRRRPWQFSLKGLLLFVTAASVVLSCVAQPAMHWRRERAVIDRLTERVAPAPLDVHYTTVRPWGYSFVSRFGGDSMYQRVVALKAPGMPIGDEDVAGLADLKHLRSLDLSGTQLTDACASHWPRIADLDTLDLSRTKIGDATAARIAQCRQLRSLSLEDTKLTDKGLRALKALVGLEELKLAGTEVTYEGLAELDAALPGVNDLATWHAFSEIGRMPGYSRAWFNWEKLPPYLDVSRLPARPLSPREINHIEHMPAVRLHYLDSATDANLAGLANFRCVRELDLNGATRLTSAALKHIGKMTWLRVLNLSETRMQDPDLTHLRALKELDTLILGGPEINNQAVAALGGLPNLRVLSLKNTQVDGEVLSVLVKLPKLETLCLDSVELIYDDDLAGLSSAPCLKEVSLNASRVVGPGLSHLHNVKTLRKLGLSRHLVDREALSELKKALPDLQVAVPADNRGRNPRGYYERAGTDRASVHNLPRVVGVAEAFQEGKYAEAAQKLKRLEESPFGSWACSYWRGCAFRLAGDNEQAVATYHRALEKLDRYIAGESGYNRRSLQEQWYSLIMLTAHLELNALGDPRAALGTLEEHNRHGAPRWPKSYRIAAPAHEQLGDREQALACWRRVPEMQFGGQSYGRASWYRDATDAIARLTRESDIIRDQRTPSGSPAAADSIELPDPFALIRPESAAPIDAGWTGASMIELPDGRTLLAYWRPSPATRTDLYLTTSSDRRRWEPPWAFEHNDCFHACDPQLFFHEDEIWLFYASDRLDFDAVMSPIGNTTYWISRSRDGRKWTAPRRTSGQRIRVRQLADGSFLKQDGFAVRFGETPECRGDTFDPTPADWHVDPDSSLRRTSLVAQDDCGRLHCIIVSRSEPIRYCAWEGTKLVVSPIPVSNPFALNRPVDNHPFDLMTYRDFLLVFHRAGSSIFVQPLRVKPGRIEGGEPYRITSRHYWPCDNAPSTHFVTRDHHLIIPFGNQEPLLAEVDLDELLGRFETEGSYVSRLREILQTQTGPGREQTLRALYELGTDAQESLPEVMACYGDEDQAVHSMAINALHRIVPGAVPQLITAMTDPNPRVRAAAAYGLSHLRADAVEAVPALRIAIKDRDDSVRINAIGALGCIGPAARAAVADLRTIGNDPDREVRQAVAHALRAIEQ